jgi:2-methylcitrate dehydratase PrpD
LWSASLAARGVTGARSALEGKAGFFRTYVGSEPPDEDEVVGPWDRAAIEEISIKQFPSCGANHRATQAAIALATEEDLRPEDLEQVDLWIGATDVWFVGAPFEIKKDPQVDAQFNIAYAVALGLIHRKAGLKQYAAESVVSDDAVADLARTVHIHEIEGTKAKLTYEIPVTLQVKTRDDRTLSRTVLKLKGSPEDPMTCAEIAGKFRECTDFAGVWPSACVEVVVSAIERVEAVADIAEFVREVLVLREPGLDEG